MERIARNRKAFDEKQNDFKHLNKKPSMLASINFKANQYDNPLKILPNLHNVSHNYQSCNPSYNERPSLTLEYRKPEIQQGKSIVPHVVPDEISNSRAYCKVYQKDLNKYLEKCLSQQGTQSFLTGHQITSSLRARMLDWMVEVTESYKFTSKTFFAGVELMDAYFAKERMAVPVQKLHIIGVVSMLIASKMEEVYPFRLRTIYEKIVHKKIPIQEIVEMQGIVCSTLDFHTVTATFYDKIMLQLHTYVLSLQYPQSKSSNYPDFSFQNFSNNPLRKEQVLEQVTKYCSLICKFVCYNYDLVISFQKQTIAEAVISLAFQMLNLTIPGISKSSFGLNSKECQQTITLALSKYKKNFKGLNNIFKFSDDSLIKHFQDFFMMNNERKDF